MKIFTVCAGDFGTGTGIFYEGDSRLSLPNKSIVWTSLLAVVYVIKTEADIIVYMVGFREGRTMLISSDRQTFTAIRSAAIEAAAKFQASLEHFQKPKWVN